MAAARLAAWGVVLLGLEIDRDITEYRNSLIRVSKRLSDAKDQVNEVVNSALDSEDLYNTSLFVKSALNTLKTTDEYSNAHAGGRTFDCASR